MCDNFPDNLTIDAEILVDDPVAQADDKGPFNVATSFAGSIRKAARSPRRRWDDRPRPWAILLCDAPTAGADGLLG